MTYSAHISRFYLLACAVTTGLALSPPSFKAHPMAYLRPSPFRLVSAEEPTMITAGPATPRDPYYTKPLTNWFFPGASPRQSEDSVTPRGAMDFEDFGGTDDEVTNFMDWPTDFSSNSKRLMLPPLAKGMHRMRLPVQNIAAQPSATTSDKSKPTSYSFFKMMG